MLEQGGTYFVPEKLQERIVENTAEQKPTCTLARQCAELEILHILRGDAEHVNLIIVFTSSVDSTHRLA